MAGNRKSTKLIVAVFVQN